MLSPHLQDATHKNSNENRKEITTSFKELRRNQPSSTFEWENSDKNIIDNIYGNGTIINHPLGADLNSNKSWKKRAHPRAQRENKKARDDKRSPLQPFHINIPVHYLQLESLHKQD